MNLLRDLRIVPIVLVATVSLFVLKTLGLVLDGGYTISHERPPEAVVVRNAQSAAAKEAPPKNASWAQDMLGYPTGEKGRGDAKPKAVIAQTQINASDITGSVGASKEPAPKAAPKGPAAPPPNTPGMVPLDRTTSPAERAILERLHERRNDLDTRERELEMRESLLKATEKKLEDRVGELKSIEGRVNETLQKKDEAEATRFKSIVSMYEGMKAKEAARIFDRLDMKVLLDVTSQINPRKMSDILAQMTPDAAERLTVALATRLDGKASATPASSLPKIEGKPTN